MKRKMKPFSTSFVLSSTFIKKLSFNESSKSPLRPSSPNSTFQPLRNSGTVTMVTSTSPMTSTKHVGVEVAWQSVPQLEDQVPIKIVGKLPHYLGQSTLYRVGPGTIDAIHSDGVPYRPAHWFDGPSLIHAFHIDANRNTVLYRNRFLADAHIRTIEATPSTKYKQMYFGSKDPCRSFLGKLFQLWTPNPIDPVTGLPPPPNINVNVEQIPGKGVVIRTDGASNIKLDEDALAVDHYFNFEDVHPSLRGVMSCAHGHYDTDTNEFINLTFNFGLPVVQYHVFKISADGEAQTIAKFWEVPRYVHSFATTEDYIIILLCPLKLSWLPILWNQSVQSGMTFEPNVATKFVVISRRHNRVVATYKSEAFFSFHVINAFQSENGIVIDLSHYKDASIVRQPSTKRMFEHARTCGNSLTRVIMDNLSDAIKNGPNKPSMASLATISSDMFELPTINPKMHRKTYKFAYGVSTGPSREYFGVVSKVNVESGKRSTWGCRFGMVSEPVFVPDPAGSREDDGCVLVVVLNVVKRSSSIVVLDARNLKEIARGEVPQMVPQGFHGMFKWK